MLEARGLGYGDRGARRLATFDLYLRSGELTVVLGPNGAGKSTLLGLLSGVLGADRGELYLQGRELHRWPLAQRAQQMAVLTQQQPLDFAFPVRDVVAMGGYPLPLRQPELQQRVARMLDALDLERLAERSYLSLSGGEAQRVQLARVLVQRAVHGGALLLDEPLAAMDLCHQHQSLTLLKRLAAEEGHAVLVVLHDLNLAARYADQVLLLQEGKLLAQGCVPDVLQPELLSSVFGVRIARLVAEDGTWLFGSSVAEQPLSSEL